MSRSFLYSILNLLTKLWRNLRFLICCCCKGCEQRTGRNGWKEEKRVNGMMKVSCKTPWFIQKNYTQLIASSAATTSAIARSDRLPGSSDSSSSSISSCYWSSSVLQALWRHPTVSATRLWPRSCTRHAHCKQQMCALFLPPLSDSYLPTSLPPSLPAFHHLPTYLPSSFHVAFPWMIHSAGKFWAGRNLGFMSPSAHHVLCNK